MINLWLMYVEPTYSGWWLSPTPLKNMKVNWGDDIPNIWKNVKCSKPPTRSLNGSEKP